MRWKNELRTCSKCGEDKELTEFYRNGSNIRGECKPCHRDASREARNKWNLANRDPDKHAYYTQKSKAKARGIAFNLTYEEWLDWWGDDRQSGMCMCRTNDTGAYEIGNIYKATTGQNVKDYYLSKQVRG